MLDIDDPDCMLIFYRDDLAAAAVEVEGLRVALKKAKAKLVVKKAAAVKAVVELKKAKLAGE